MGSSLLSLDPKNYTVFPHVAVVDEFTLPVPKEGGEEGEYEYFQITPEFLARCVENGNRRERETGDLCPLIIGRHTKKDSNERSQPTVVGFARNWTLDKLLNTNRMAAHADLWIRNEYADDVKQKGFRRSAEIWRKRAEIDPIALLGPTTPERDLGMLPIALSRKADQEISVTYLNRGFDMYPPDDKGNDTSKMNATPGAEDTNALLKKLCAAVADLQASVDKMSGAGGAGGDGQDALAPGAEGAAAAGGEGNDPLAGMSDEEIEAWLKELEGQGGQAAAPPATAAVQPPRKDEPPAQAMGYPGGQNTFIPGGTEDKTKLNRQGDTNVTTEEAKQLREELELLKLERAKDEVTARIDKLIGDGVKIEDRDAEIKDIMAVPAEMRPVLLNRIEKNYARLPGGGKTLPSVSNAQDTSTTAGKSITASENEQVIKLARESGDSYEVAFKKKFGKFPFESGPVVRS